jgi:hypothetical protein
MAVHDRKCLCPSHIVILSASRLIDGRSCQGVVQGGEKLACIRLIEDRRPDLQDVPLGSPSRKSKPAVYGAHR